MKTAYSYVRFSRPEQAKGDSYRRQTEAAKAWADANGYRLDETLFDAGVSAFKGKNVEVGALGRFLQMVEAGRVEQGSTLVVENLDRLSRAEVWEAQTVVARIVNAGVAIHTLQDGQTYSRQSVQDNPALLFLMLAAQINANQESAKKAERLAHAWAKKRDKAASHEVYTSRVPYWLEVVDGKIRPIPERAEIVREVFSRSIDGWGVTRIANELNRRGVETFGKANRWQVSYCQKLLANRAVLGEFQPYTKVSGKRVTDGEPIANYYPPVIDSETWDRARAAADRRKNKKGRPSRDNQNLFTQLIRTEGINWQFRGREQNRSKSGLAKLYLVQDYRANWSVWYDLFEACILHWLANDADLAAVFDDSEGSNKQQREILTGQLVGVEGRISKLQQQLESADLDTIGVITPVITKLANQRTSLKAELDQLKAEAASPVSVNIATLLNGSDDRLKLMNALRAIIDHIEVSHYDDTDSRVKHCVATINYTNGKQQICQMVFMRQPQQYTAEKRTAFIRPWAFNSSQYDLSKKPIFINPEQWDDIKAGDAKLMPTTWSKGNAQKNTKRKTRGTTTISKRERSQREIKEARA